MQKPKELNSKTRPQNKLIKKNKGITIIAIVVILAILLILALQNVQQAVANQKETYTITTKDGYVATVETDGNDDITLKEVLTPTEAKERQASSAQNPNLITGTITVSAPTWTAIENATVTLSTTTGLKMQWQKNSISGMWQTGVAVTGLKHGDTVFTRLIDEEGNAADEASVSILDSIPPEVVTITKLPASATPGATITANVTHADNQSKIDITKCKWLFNTKSTNLNVNSIDWNIANTFSTNTNQISITVPNQLGNYYYLHILSVDIAGNKREIISTPIKVGSLIKGEKVPVQADGKTNVEWKETVDGKELIAKIPVGFCVVKDIKDTEGNVADENNISRGLVISDVANDDLDNTAKGNQFVWIPVDVDGNGNTPNFVRIEGFSGGIRESYLANCQEAGKEGDNISTEESRKMYQSVADNGGFYIARFEAGIDGMTTPNESADNVPTPDGNTKPVSKKGVSPWNFIPWSTSTENGSDGLQGDDGADGAVKVARSMYTKSNTCGVTSTLCYGVQWDAVLQFIEPNYLWKIGETDNVPEDSIVRNGEGKGNYSKLKVTGQYQQNHIYDLAGNMGELTMEAYGAGGRVVRGGYCFLTGSGAPASSRCYIYYPDRLDSRDFGFRQALYL